MEYCNSNDLWVSLDGGWSVSAVQHHNEMNVGLLETMATDSARLSMLSHLPCLNRQTLVLLHSKIPSCCKYLIWTASSRVQLKAQSVAAKSLGQYKSETFLLPQTELARFSSDSAKLVALQCRMKHLDRVERDLDLAMRQPAGTMDLQDTASCTASRGPARGCSPPRRNHENSSNRCSTQTANSVLAKRRKLLCTARTARVMEYACACASQIACVPA